MERESAESIRDEIRASLNEIWDSTNRRGIRDAVSAVSDKLDRLCECYEELLAETDTEEMSEQEIFELRYRQLAGLVDEVTAIARKKPEAPCKSFKAEQANQVLRPLKELMEEDMGVSLSLVSEKGAHSYSDVSLILRGYLDVSSVYARRHYSLNYDMHGQKLPNPRYGFRN